MTSRSCSICAHRQRKAIDRALVAGESIRTVAGRYGVPKSTLADHKAHLDTVAGPVAREVAVERAAVVAAAETEVRAAMVEAGQTTLQRVRTLGDVAAKCLARVTGKLDGEHLEPGDVADIDFPAREVAALMGQSLKALELQAKLLGELQSGTRDDGRFEAAKAEFIAVIIGALARHPEALADVRSAAQKAAERRRALPGGGR